MNGDAASFSHTRASSNSASLTRDATNTPSATIVQSTSVRLFATKPNGPASEPLRRLRSHAIANSRTSRHLKARSANHAPTQTKSVVNRRKHLLVRIDVLQNLARPQSHTRKRLVRDRNGKPRLLAQ